MTTTKDPAMTEAETERFITDVLRASGADGMTRGDLADAHEAFRAMVFDAGFVWLWQHQKVTVAWDTVDRELRFTLVASEVQP